MEQVSRWLLVLGVSAGALYVLLLAFMAGKQGDMLYFPTIKPESELRQEALALGFLPWENASGGLIGWRASTSADPSNRADAPTSADAPNRLLVFHGNGGMALNRAYLAAGFEAFGGGQWELFVMEYPGYGARPGVPGEAEFRRAAQEAFKQLESDGTRPIYLLGESIGAGVATGLAAETPQVAGLILITPFTSLSAVATKHYPWAPVRLILRDRFDNAAALARYDGPLAVVVAGRDTIVPMEQGRELYESYRHRKRLWIHEEAGHNTLDYGASASWLGEVSEFLLESTTGPTS